MFVDSSAVIGIIAGEDDAPSLAARLAQAPAIYISPIAQWEAVVGLVRKRACPFEEAEELVRLFIEESRARTIEIDGVVGGQALKASRRYGKGRHRADLNMGDCFAYACARVAQVPLLCKGNDFVHTDILVA